MHELSKLAMGRRKKAGIMLMFLGGSFVTVVSMLRLKYMIQFSNSTNVTWDYTPIGYWSTLEVHVGIIIACLPAVRSLQRRMFPSSRTTQNSYYLGPAGAYGYNSKGGSPFPSIVKHKGGHIDLVTAASQTRPRDRERTKNDKEFIPLEELDSHTDEKMPSRDSDDAYHHGGQNTIQVTRGSTHSDDGAMSLPIQGTHNVAMPRSVHQNHGRNISPQGPPVINIRKDYTVTVEVTPDQLSSSPPGEEPDHGVIIRR